MKRGKELNQILCDSARYGVEKGILYLTIDDALACGRLVHMVLYSMYGDLAPFPS